VNQETETYEMSVPEIAAELKIPEKTVGQILHQAIAKLRAHPQVWAEFREAVREKRRALDARPGNGPWHYTKAMKFNAQGQQAG
jgi:hypothetical protein